MAHFLDTSILLYAISPHPAEADKRSVAAALLNQDDGAISVQVLQEFYVQATRPSRAGRLPHDLAVGLLRAWARFPVQETTMPIVEAALEIKSAHGFSYWDSAIIATARALGCRQLYSEDMSHGRVVAGVTIVNPFLASG
ncbi:PIN domain-containing protein [Rhodopila sp.]|uniref:PIN domain-containing protein n=1 Tax=Rhodopila sp. TaxID=2480087 RepID=UPI003D0B5B86